MTTHDIEAMTAELVRAHHVIADLTDERNRLRADRDLIRGRADAERSMFVGLMKEIEADRDRLHAALVSIRAGHCDAVSVAEKALRGRL